MREDTRKEFGFVAVYFKGAKYLGLLLLINDLF